MMCFWCTKIAIIVLYGFRFVLCFFLRRSHRPHYLRRHIYCLTSGAEEMAADTVELRFPFDFYIPVELCFLSSLPSRRYSSVLVSIRPSQLEIYVALLASK